MWFRLFIINLPYKSIAQRHTYKKNAFSHTASKTYNEIQRTASSFRPVCWKIGDIHPSFSLVRCDGRHSRDTSSHDLKRDIAAAGTVGARREKHHQPATSWFVLVRRRRVSWCPRTYRPACLAKRIFMQNFIRISPSYFRRAHTDTHTKSLLVNWLVVESKENFFVKSEPPSVFSPHSPHTQISEWRWFRLMPFGCCSCICVHVQFHCMCCCKRSFSSVVAIVAFDELKCTCNH